MERDSQRRVSAAGKVAMELMLLAADARKTGRWANGAAILEESAQDLIVNAAKPEARRERIALQNLAWLLKPKR